MGMISFFVGRTAAMKRFRRKSKIRPLKTILTPEQEEQVRAMKRHRSSPLITLRQTRVARKFFRDNPQLFSDVFRAIKQHMYDLSAERQKDILIILPNEVVITKEATGDYKGRQRGGFLIKVKTKNGTFFVKARQTKAKKHNPIDDMLRQIHHVDELLSRKGYVVKGQKVRLMQYHVAFKDKEHGILQQNSFREKMSSHIMVLEKEKSLQEHSV